MKTFSSLLLIILFTCFSFFSAAQSVGDAAPDFSLQTLDGGEFNLSSKQGNVVFIFLFGYACPHCLANGNNTEELYQKYKDQEGFIAVGVDTWDGNSAGVENFMSSTGVSYTLCLEASSLEDLYNTTYDRIIVVDKDGIIRFKSTSNSISAVVDQADDAVATYLAMDAGMGGGDGGSDMMGDGGTVTALKRIDSYQNQALVFPNPVKNVVNIDAKLFAESDVDVKIFDVAGKKAIEKKLINNNEEIINVPVDQLRDGLYILQLSGRYLQITQRFIVRK